MSDDSPSDKPTQKAEDSPKPASAGDESSVQALAVKQKRRFRKPEDAPDEAPRPADDPPPRTPAPREPSDEETGATRNAINRTLRRARAGTRVPGSPSATGESAGASDDPGATPDRAHGAQEPPAPVALPKFQPSTFAGRASFWSGKGPIIGRILLCAAVAAAIAAVAFMAGRKTSVPVAKPLKAPEAVRPVTSLPVYSEMMQKALALDHAGDLDGALRLTDELANSSPPGADLQAYRATLETRLGRTLDVEADLCHLLGTDVSADVSATINAARGFNLDRRRQFDVALDCFAAVARSRPFDTANLLHWGETLRRLGNLGDAAAKLQQALDFLPVTDSPYVEAQRDYLAYVRRLTLIENGRGATLQTELEQRLGDPLPSGYWLLTGAALALQNGNIPVAVDALKKAQPRFSKAQYDTLLGDYFYRSFAYHAELGEFLVSPSPEELEAKRRSMDYFVDP